ncbi:MAG: GT4 family glycosyltransferase PelF [Microthrixaceae bacterium]
MRVRLITEGNYPTVVGGVSHWCEFLLRGLPEIDWSVMALGVEPPVGGEPLPAPVTYPATARNETGHEAPPTLIDRLVRQLFNPVEDPDALLSALVACRGHQAPITSPLLRRLVSELVEELLQESQVPVSPGGRSQLLSLAIELVDEVLLIAGTPGSPVDAHLVACAGRAVIPAAIDRALFGTPLALVEHGVYVHEANLRTSGSEVDPSVRQLVRRSAYNLAALGYATADTVVGVSEANCRRSVSFGADPDRTLVIPNGVRVPDLPPPLHPGQVVGTVGRIDSFKGVDVFIRAAGVIAEHQPEARFVHIGPVEHPGSEYQATCRDLVIEAGLEGRFTFFGYHPDPTELLASLDVFVLPSRSEGLPFALLEAMAASRPIVASSVGGVPEALRDGAGLLVAPDDPPALARSVTALLTDRARAAQLGRRAHREVQLRFRVEDMICGYRELLQAITASRVATA